MPLLALAPAVVVKRGAQGAEILAVGMCTSVGVGARKTAAAVRAAHIALAVAAAAECLCDQ